MTALTKAPARKPEIFRQRWHVMWRQVAISASLSPGAELPRSRILVFFDTQNLASRTDQGRQCLPS
jgi:hypothetical protein